MPPAKTACIIGAGPCGLVAAKYLLEQRFPAPPGQLGAPKFKVTIFESKARIGGLWPVSKDDVGADIHPLMRTNQSKHTVQFSDLAWGPDAPEFPYAWQVGQYLGRYYERYCRGAELKLNERVDLAAPTERDGHPGQWAITTCKGQEQTERRLFDCVVVGSGYFGKPIIPAEFQSTAVPIITSTQYRDIGSLLGPGLDNAALDAKIKALPAEKPKIVVVGGQMSGVEIAGTIATHLSSAAKSTKERAVPNASRCRVLHIAEQPAWIFPLFTTPNPPEPSPPFLPVDLSSYNLANRPKPLTNTQGSLSLEAAKNLNGIFSHILGGTQEQFGSVLDMRKKGLDEQPPLLAMSQHYAEFVRLGLVQPVRAKMTAFSGNEGTISASEYSQTPSDQHITDVAAVVVAAGFDATSSISFFPEDVKARLGYQPPSAFSKNRGHILALAFHSTYHSRVPGLGFVGFYRSPYWGVMEMQARFLATMFSSSLFGEQLPTSLQASIDGDSSGERAVALRNDPRITQFPMGDYIWLMEQFGQALDIKISQPGNDDLPLPPTPPTNLPMDVLTPARYMSYSATADQISEAQESLRQTREAIVDGLTKRKFLAQAVFRSLHGEWHLERKHVSAKYADQNGSFSGKVTFHLREGTVDGRVPGDTPSLAATDLDLGLEYLLVEEGTFRLPSGFEFQTTRRYIWRYDEAADRISVWFVLPDDNTRAEKLFHELDFSPGPSEGGRQAQGGGRVGGASGGHLCEQDYYMSRYDFRFCSVNLNEWSLDVAVNGPRKNYSTTGEYRRIFPRS